MDRNLSKRYKSIIKNCEIIDDSQNMKWGEKDINNLFPYFIFFVDNRGINDILVGLVMIVFLKEV
jgi:hypothetical protein